MSNDAPPPSYTEATGGADDKDYLSTRSPPPPIVTSKVGNDDAEREKNLLTFPISTSTPAGKTPFPSPEDAWSERDVTNVDWYHFLQQLEKGTPTPEEVLAEWNAKFFGPRGCRVVIAGAAPTTTAPAAAAAAAATTEAAAASGEASSSSDSGGLGFKVGNSYVGFLTGKNSDGYGLKLGPLLIGVHTDSKEKKDAEEAAKRKTT